MAASNDIEETVVDEDITFKVDNKHYNLNQNVAMIKKFQATRREDFVFEETEGGIKMLLSAGAFELLKMATFNFYTRSVDNYSYQKTISKDQSGNTVEMRYRAFKGKVHLYTLNIYTTRCTCLVNGKSANYFIKVDLPSMLDYIEDQLTQGNASIADVNDTIRLWIRDYFKITADAPESKTSCDREIQQSDSPLTIIADINVVQDLSKQNTLPTLPCEYKITENNLDQSSSEESNEPVASTQEISALQLNTCSSTGADKIVSDMKSEFAKLADTVQEQLSQMHGMIALVKDEIQSVKHLITVHSQVASRKIEDVSENLDILNKSSESVKQRLQSIADKLQSKWANKPSTPMTPHPDVQESQIPLRQPANRSLIIGDSIVRGISSPKVTVDPETRRSNVSTQQCNVLIIGDSVTRCLNTKEMGDIEGELHVTIKSNPGAKISNIQAKLDQLAQNQNDAPTNFDAVVIHAGVNNISEGETPEQIVTDYKMLAAKTQEKFGFRKLIVSSVLPMRRMKVAQPIITEVNSKLQIMCQELGYEFVDHTTSFANNPSLYYDELHCNTSGAYKLGFNLKTAIINTLELNIRRKSGTNSHFRLGQSANNRHWSQNQDRHYPTDQDRHYRTNQDRHYQTDQDRHYRTNKDRLYRTNQDQQYRSNQRNMPTRDVRYPARHNTSQRPFCTNCQRFNHMTQQCRQTFHYNDTAHYQNRDYHPHPYGNYRSNYHK